MYTCICTYKAYSEVCNITKALRGCVMWSYFPVAVTSCTQLQSGGHRVPCQPCLPTSTPVSLCGVEDCSREGEGKVYSVCHAKSFDMMHRYPPSIVHRILNGSAITDLHVLPSQVFKEAPPHDRCESVSDVPHHLQLTEVAPERAVRLQLPLHLLQLLSSSLHLVHIIMQRMHT